MNEGDVRESMQTNDHILGSFILLCDLSMSYPPSTSPLYLLMAMKSSPLSTILGWLITQPGWTNIPCISSTPKFSPIQVTRPQLSEI